MIIKNKQELGTTKLRKIALELIEAGINRVMPANLLQTSIRFNNDTKILTIHGEDYNLSAGRLFVVGGGKAVGLMAEEIEKIIGVENITAGLVNCTSSDYETAKIEVMEAGHPLPNKKSVKGVIKMMELKQKYNINQNDLVLCLISGGGSSLMTYNVKTVTLKEKQKMTDLLIHSGASIQETNQVRKHLSEIKGGKLGRFFAPATVASLIISDVVSNDIESIASGPTVPDSSTYEDALAVLKKYDLLEKAPKDVIKFLQTSIETNAEDTPDQLDNCFNYIIGDNILALGAIADKAHHLGLKPIVVTAEQTGDPAVVAQIRAREILDGEYLDFDTIILGGETTPCIPENAGEGGRNQHFTATSLLEMEKYQGDWLVAAVSTDGIDYVKDVAGAIIDNNSLNSIKCKKLDVKKYLEEYNSYKLLKKLENSLIITGETGTNVSDIMIYIIK